MRDQLKVNVITLAKILENENMKQFYSLATAGIFRGIFSKDL